MDRISKSFAVFDCDAHVNDPEQIWDHVPEAKRDLVRGTYWRDDNHAVLNGATEVFGGGSGAYGPTYNSICIAGPQMNKKIMRKLISMVPLTPEQKEYVRHRGPTEAAGRIREMDLMGIDQVLVIPTMVIMNLPFATNAEGVDVFCQAYNDWLRDWCDEFPDRLYGAALLPLQDPARAAAEVRRSSNLGHPVGLIRPIDARGAYPNDIGGLMSPASDSNFDVLFRAFEESGMVLGMHTFPAPNFPHPLGRGFRASPGEPFGEAGCDSQTLSFVYEAQTWLTQVLMGGFLDRYPNLKMAIFESNSQWLPYFLDTCDRLFKAYRNERAVTSARRLPSEAFYEQCVISFEADEVQVFRQWKQFESVGIWASDAYHHDGADAWSALRAMRQVGVPEPVQEKLMGANALRTYGITPRVFVKDEPGPIERPDWFPQGPELEEWANVVAHPRENADRMRELGFDPISVLQRQQSATGSSGASY